MGMIHRSFFFIIRQSLYCVPVPGESFWVKKFDSGAEKLTPREMDSMQTESATPVQVRLQDLEGNE